MIRDGVVAGTREPMAVNNSPVVSYRNADLELDKIVFRSNKGKKKKEYVTYLKAIIDIIFRYNAQRQTNEESYKIILANI